MQNFDAAMLCNTLFLLFPASTTLASSLTRRSAILHTATAAAATATPVSAIAPLAPSVPLPSPLLSSPLLSSPPLPPPVPLPSPTLPPPQLSLPSAVALIRSSCPPDFLRAVEASDAFLYRGEDTGAAPCILSPPPDLLDASTYGSERAVAYFRCLEEALPARTRARPSTGHIGTSTRRDAEAWGAAASVWPLGGSRLSYVWPLRKRLFFDSADDAGAGADGAGCSARAFEGGLTASFGVDAGLRQALASGHELLFAAPAGFVTVPAALDAPLRAALRLRGGAAVATTTSSSRPALPSVACGMRVRRVTHGDVGGLHTLEADYAAASAATAATNADAAPLQPHDGLATCFWPAARPLAAALHSPALLPSLAGVRVLELGCGTGVCSLAAAARGATVLATDVEPVALCLVRRAAAEQQIATLQTAPFDAMCAEAALPTVEGGPAELLVMSDLFVTPGLATALAARAVEATRSGTTVLVVDPGRPTRRDFVAALQAAQGSTAAPASRPCFRDVADAAAWSEVTPGAGGLHLFGTEEGAPVFYEI